MKDCTVLEVKKILCQLEKKIDDILHAGCKNELYKTSCARLLECDRAGRCWTCAMAAGGRKHKRPKLDSVKDDYSHGCTADELLLILDRVDRKYDTMMLRLDESRRKINIRLSLFHAQRLNSERYMGNR